MKEALCIRLTPEDAHFNHDSGYELPDSWITTLHRLGGGVSLYQANSDLGITRPGEVMRMFIFSYLQECLTGSASFHPEED